MPSSFAKELDKETIPEAGGAYDANRLEEIIRERGGK